MVPVVKVERLGGAEQADEGGEPVEGEGGEVGQQHHLPAPRHRQVLGLTTQRKKRK